ncbi:hypothetical protein [Treponema sp. R80B11-R83G3]
MRHSIKTQKTALEGVLLGVKGKCDTVMGINAVLWAFMGVIKGVLNGVCGNKYSGLLNAVM